MSAKNTSRIWQTVQAAADRGLSEPLLLFMAGHRPLAFVASQLVLLVAPIAALIGYPGFQEWSEILSDPRSLDRLEHTLEDWPSRAANRVPAEDNLAERQPLPEPYHPDTRSVDQRKNRFL